MGQSSCRMSGWWSWQNFSPTSARKRRNDRWAISMDMRSRAKTGQKSLQRASTTTLRTRQRTIGKQLRVLNAQVIRGSLITRYTRCGKPRCRCVTGRGHGPKYYLSVSRIGKRPHLIYVSQARVAQIREQLAPLPTLSHALGGAVRHRLRVTYPTGNSVARINGVGQPASGGVSRCDGRQSTRGQHVGTCRERSPLAHVGTGGGTPCARR